MSEPVIRVRGARKSFDEGRIVALNGMDLDVADGEFVAIVGPSGCGKSTLLHLIAALDRPDSGSIRVGGHELAAEHDLNHYRSRHIGMVFQLHNLLPSLTAEENVQVPMLELGLARPERRRRARRLLDAVGLVGRERNRPPELSGGERQRVALARALANEPPILLADEPTGSLDSDAGRRVLDLLSELRRTRGLTVLLVTHDLGVASRADRIVTMLDGRVAPLDPEQAAALRLDVGRQGQEGGDPDHLEELQDLHGGHAPILLPSRGRDVGGAPESSVRGTEAALRESAERGPASPRIPRAARGRRSESE